MNLHRAGALLILGDGLSPSLESTHISPKKGLNLRDKPSKSPFPENLRELGSWIPFKTPSRHTTQVFLGFITI